MADARVIEVSIAERAPVLDGESCLVCTAEQRYVTEIDGTPCATYIDWFAITFALTLVMAPHLEKSIIVGVLLSLGLYLYRSMRPRFAELSIHSDGTFRDAAVHNLQRCKHISVLRFDGSLYFANAGYFETKVLQNVASKPELKFVVLDLEGVNEIDATGEEVIGNLHERLGQGGVRVLIARPKRQTMQIMDRSGLADEIGREHFFRTRTDAIEYARAQLGDEVVDDALRNVGLSLEEVSKRYPHELSGGQTQRVSVARALISQPKLILADEPTGNLDEETAEEITKLIFAMNKELGTTLVMVTHNKELAEMTERILYLKSGELVEDKRMTVS